MDTSTSTDTGSITTPAITLKDAAAAPFGTLFGDVMAVSRCVDGEWTGAGVEPLAAFTIHPGTHALHYGSSCFEGLKAHRWGDDTVRTFRADRHVARLRQSADRLLLPVPPVALVTELIERTVTANAHLAPPPPGSLYLRPTLLGTDITIGAAAYPSGSAILYVLACPVGDYLPPRPLTVAVETTVPRTTPQFGVVKTGANYAMALGRIAAARKACGADQVLFAPGGQLEETGAANVVLIDGDHLVTPALTDAFLHGVTRDSLLQVAAHLGWHVDERVVTVDECVEWARCPGAELALAGTAAVLATVGTLVVAGEPIEVGAGVAPTRTAELRWRLISIQTGATEFAFAERYLGGIHPTGADRPG
jgi:branched-chain amino acid aminotransferase